MLNVHFLRLIAREGGIESGQNAVGLKSFQVRAIRKIAGFALRSKEQPISATCSDCLAFLKKCTEWRQSCAWTNHDHCGIRILREMEMFGDGRINRHRTIVRSISQKCGGDACTHPSMTFITDYINHKVHFVWIEAQTGSDRIKPRLQL